MEEKIREENRDTSLCFDSSGDDLANLSLLEKYDRFVQNSNLDINDSDGDFFPDDSILKKEYARLTSVASGHSYSRNHRLSTCLPGKFKSLPLTNRSSDCTRDTGNGTLRVDSDRRFSTSEHDATITEESTRPQPGSCLIRGLIDKLGEFRHTEPDGNSIFCEQDDLEAIQERYGAILDFIHEKSVTFEQRSSSKDSENEEQVDVGNAAPVEQRESMRLLAEKIVSVQQARDKFYEVEQSVREQVEQLELVERYKMESVG